MHPTSINRLAAGFAAAAALGFFAPALGRAAAFPPLNSPASSQQVPGKFIWADLFTNDPAAATTFYTGVFGWTSTQMEQKERTYVILSNGDHPVAGIVMRKASSTKGAGVWVGYLSVANAKASLAAAVAAGGTEHASVRNFPERGYQAILSDNEGSAVGILQSSSGDRSDDEPTPGDWNWFELYTLKPKMTTDFYGKAFGYDVKPDDRSELKGHFVLSSGAKARAGVAPLPASADASSGWLGFVRVANIDDVVAKASTMGGTVVVAPRAAALGSRFAVITDPTGGDIGLIQYEDNANPADRP